MKRTPIKRTAPLVRASGLQARTKAPVLRCRLCEGCRLVKFRPARSNITWCSDDCGVTVAQARVAAANARQHRAALQAVKPLSHWHDLTERVVNAYIRLRDSHLPCISCGTWSTVQWEAGHYLSKGAHPELRYHLLNIHKQCHRCNVQLSGNQIKYRIGLVPKIGEAAVLVLEGPHPAAKHSREELASIRRTVSAATRELQRQIDAGTYPPPIHTFGAASARIP